MHPQRGNGDLGTGAAGRIRRRGLFIVASGTLSGHRRGHVSP
jgi:hypothetical protein